MHSGFLYAFAAFGLWGLFPLYFLLIAAVPAVEVVLQRALWSLLFIAVVLAWQRRWSWLAPFVAQPRRLLPFVLSALLLVVNTFTYVHAVQTHQVVEASLGYYINPLVNVLLGVLVLRERLGAVQWVAVGLAALGVLWLTWQLGRLPWIALALACSFGLYGLVRKTAQLGALEGLARETLLLAPLVLPLLAWWTITQHGVWLQGDVGLLGLMALLGPLTTIPLLCFTAAARRMPLATLGLVQYMSPTVQLLLGVWVFNEPFGGSRLFGFALIWAALLLVSLHALRQSFKGAGAAPVETPR